MAQAKVIINGDSKGAEKAMGNVEKSSSKLKSALKVGLAGGALAVGAAFVSMAKTGLDNIKDIDNATQDFISTTGASAEEAKRFSNTIQNLHKTNTDSYEELGAAVTTLQQRHGNLGDEMDEQTQKFLNYAKVTGQDTPNAINDLADIMKAFNVPLEESGKLMDTLKAISAETGADIGNLQKSVADSQPLFTALNMSLEEGAAMLGHFEGQGVSATIATRGLRNVIERTQGPTDAEVAALERLGVELTETKDGIVAVGGPSGALEQIIAKLSEGDLSAQEMAAATQILGQRAGVDMVRALKNGEVGIEELMSVVENSEGTVASASEEYDKKLGERWQLIQRKYLEPFMETIGTTLMNILESLLDFADEWGPKVAAVFETLSTFVSSIFSLMESDSDSSWGKIWSTISKIAGQIQEVISTFVEWAKLFWKEYGEDIVATAKIYFQQISDTIGTVFDLISGIFEVFIGLITGDWERMGQGLQDIWESWTGYIVRSAERLWSIIITVKDNVTNYFNKMKENVIQLMQDMIDGVVEWFDNSKLGKIVNMAGEATEKVTGFFKGMWDKVVGHSYVPDMVTGVINEFSKMGTAMVEKTLSSTSTAQDNFKLFRDNVMTWFKEIANSSTGASASFADSMVDMVDSVTSGNKTIKEALKDMLIAFITTLEKEVLAVQIAEVAKATMQAPLTFGATLAAIPAILSAAAPALIGFEAIKAGIRGLAEGGTTLTSGSVLVGERGPELLDLPRGARVTPLEKARARNVFNINFNNPQINNGIDIDRMAERFVRKVKLAGVNL